MKAFLRKVYWLLKRRDKDAELREELAFHLDEDAEERERSGVATDEARHAARRELGNVTLVQENTRSAWGWTLVEQLAQDLRYAVRTMSANKAFTLLAVLSLALGIGANTAIYSFVDAILMRSLPVEDPQSLVVLNWHSKPYVRDSVMHGMSGNTWLDTRLGETSGMFPYPAFELFRTNDRVFSSVFAHYQYWQMRKLNFAHNSESQIAMGWSVSGDYFNGLGIVPAAGRLIASNDDRPGNAGVVVSSYAFSQRHFSDPAKAVGEQVTIDNVPFRLIGVTPPDFFGVDPSTSPDLYFPMHANELLGEGHQFGFNPGDYHERNFYWTQIMGRLRPGVTIAQAQVQLAPMFRQWVTPTAENDRERANLPQLIVREGAGGLDDLRRRYSKPLYVLLGLVGLILALACANVANLLLGRSAARRREIAMRLSVGASRGRVMRQLLTESVLLATIGGILGVFLALWGIRFLTFMLASARGGFPIRVDVNWHVLAVAALLSLITGVIFGLAPAWQLTRVDVMPALKESRDEPLRTTRFLRRASLSQVLVSAQIAISLLMLFAAGLFVRTLSNLESINLGFNRENVLLFQLDARKAGYKDPEVSRFYGDLRNRFRDIQGVRDVSLSEDSLLRAGTGYPLAVQGTQPNPKNRLLRVGPDFFKTMGIALVAGRDFDDRDRPGSPAVAVVNQEFVKVNLDGRNPIGLRLRLWKGKKTADPVRDMEIVGVCRNATYGNITEAPRPVAFLPYDQGFPQPDGMVFALRTSGDPSKYVNPAREIVRSADAHVPVSDIRTQLAEIEQEVNQEITFARLCSGFAILALIIACVGLYGAVSYSVARRTSEIGIRMALGAQRDRVMRMILGEVLKLVAAGLALGTATALGTSRIVESFLYGIKHNDAGTLALSVGILVAAAVIAGYVPAWKASRIDPMIAVRHE